MSNALHKVCPILNIVKVTLRAFIRLGSEVALDEASEVASRSSYGRSVIFFDPMKCGKFYAHFYLLLYAKTFACVRMKVVTKNISENPDHDQKMGTIYNTTRMSNLFKLVKEMHKPFFGSNITVSTYMFTRRLLF
jgi:hypothetical protein